MQLPFHEETMRCRAAQREWARLPVHRRLRCVRALRHLLADSADAIALAVTQDVGRPVDEVLATDILPTADACQYLERRAATLLAPHRLPRWDRPLWLLRARSTVFRRPHGVVGVIGTWNYPIFLNAIQIAQALTAGNGVLWKPSELTPAVAEKLHRLFLTAGFPAELFARLPAAREAGQELAEAAIDHLVFTGSADVGRKLAARLGERLIPSTLELSGCDMLVVGADSKLRLAAKGAWFGTTLNKGQTCLAIRRIFVERPAYIRFLDYLRAFAATARHQPLMHAAAAEQAERLVRSAVADGASLLLPGSVPRADDDPPRYPATFVVHARTTMAICREAAFAPIAAVMPFDHLSEVVAAQEECPYALGASIFMADRARALRLAETLPAGSVSINDVMAPTAHPATPFGGRHASGWGVTQGAEGLLAMTEPQSVCIRRGRWRPHFDSADGAPPATNELLRGILEWCHSGSWRRRMAGLWHMIRGLWRSA
jgi:acyl-CoA reductase-like NAD-dependent aldehyde dehydrogenase